MMRVETNQDFLARSHGAGDADDETVFVAVGQQFGFPGVAGGFRGAAHGDGGLGGGPVDVATPGALCFSSSFTRGCRNAFQRSIESDSRGQSSRARSIELWISNG